MATGGHYITVLPADCITCPFCPPVSMMKDAMESIHCDSEVNMQCIHVQFRFTKELMLQVSPM